MPTTPVVCPKQPFPLELDVQVNIYRPQTEIATDMSLLCFVTPAAPFPPNNGRVRYYSSITSLEEDFAPGTEAWFAGQAFFAREDKPLYMAVGQVFEDPVPAGLIAGDIDLAALKNITHGAFALMVNEGLEEITGLDFSGVSTAADIVGILAAAVSSDLEISWNFGSVVIETAQAGAGATLSYAESPSSGTDVSGLLGLTKETSAQLWQGYDPEGLLAEAAMIATASRCNDRFIFGWILDRVYRDTQDQKDFADWIEARNAACVLTTNAASAYNTQDTTNILYYTENKRLKQTDVFYFDNPQQYGDVSYLAMFLAVDYGLPDSAITGKFKELPGIDPSTLSETQLAAIVSRRGNVYVRMGNTSTVIREGTQASESWFTDSWINIANFRNELQTEVFNAFLQHRKIPYTPAGQNILISAANLICRKYTDNGVFADRDIPAIGVESGFIRKPATEIIARNVAYATKSERAARIAPPMRIVAYEAGAFHQIGINIDFV